VKYKKLIVIVTTPITIVKMEIAQKKKHCGLPAPPGIYKPRGENKVTGRRKDYAIIDLANLQIPEDALDGEYTTMTELDVNVLNLHDICSPNFLQGYPNGNNPSDYQIILAMSENIHSNPLIYKIALLNTVSGQIELFTTTTSTEQQLIGKGQTVECFNPSWKVWKRASMDADVIFWRRLKEISQNLNYNGC